MFDSSVAVLFDAGYLWRTWDRILGRKPAPQDVIDLSKGLLKEGEKLFRTYFYDCEPFKGEKIHPVTGEKKDYSKTDTYTSRSVFLENLSVRDNIAFRRGRLSHKGWGLSKAANEKFLKSMKYEKQPQLSQWQPALADIQPQFSQKAVDMKIGLDVAWLSSKNIVGTIILFGCDTDYVPAMKHARREGCRVAIACFPNSKRPDRPDLHPELMEHADECRVMRYESGAFTQVSLIQ
jgi:uncharacterized LabA/DUF88 family protein